MLSAMEGADAEAGLELPAPAGDGSGFRAGGCKTKIKTDCKKHLGPGDVFGDFTVISGTSLLGGPLCAFDDPACDSGSGSGSGSNASDD